MSIYWESLLVVGGINAILAWSLGLVVRSGQLSVGHAAIAGVGGYTAGLLVLEGIPPIVTLVLASVAAGLVGFLLALMTLRLNHLFLALATLVFGEILSVVATGSPLLGGAAGLAGLPLLVLGPLVLGSVVLILVVEVVLFRGSRFDLSTLLLSADSTLVDMAGNSSAWLRVYAFAISSSVAGFAGALLAFQAGVVQPSDLAFANSLNLLVYVVIGGSTSGLGALIGGFSLSVLPNAVHLDSIQNSLLLGMILVAVMLLRRDGLISRRPIRFLNLGGSDGSGGPEPPLVDAGSPSRRATI